MFGGNSRKIFLAASISLILLAACRFRQENETANSNQNSSVVDEAAVAPFPSKEPETYQAEIVTETCADGVKTERKTLTARSGARRLTIFNLGEKNEISDLEYADGGISLLSFPAKRIYAENKTASGGSANSTDDFLTTGWLNAEASPASFEKLETENSLTKFRVRLDDAGKSESLIYFDENLKIPVRQEFYSVEGERKTLMYAVEIKNFKSEVDGNLFDPPKDYLKVSLKEFQEAVRREK